MFQVYEGPGLWNDALAQLVIDSTKGPLFGSLKEAADATGFSEEFLSVESGRYIHMAYVKLRTSLPRN